MEFPSFATPTHEDLFSGHFTSSRTYQTFQVPTAFDDEVPFSQYLDLLETEYPDAQALSLAQNAEAWDSLEFVSVGHGQQQPLIAQPALGVGCDSPNSSRYSDESQGVSVRS